MPSHHRPTYYLLTHLCIREICGFLPLPPAAEYILIIADFLTDAGSATWLVEVKENTQ
ncbi:protein of unknown function [Candidatus Promineifilum breve]|uniref:Uncharacterized protein n=1 Tax=Candidatus Promineifilum breve TaxID=1806508 RepID=A0A160T8A0_9CHLR|nr:protein of unknown function [Candidatus Promineifilum breve]